MSEVNRYAAGEIFDGAEVVYAADFDRVTAELDEALRREAALVRELEAESEGADRAAESLMEWRRDCLALQQRLTAADELVSFVTGLMIRCAHHVGDGADKYIMGDINHYLSTGSTEPPNRRIVDLAENNPGFRFSISANNVKVSGHSEPHSVTKITYGEGVKFPMADTNYTVTACPAENIEGMKNVLSAFERMFCEQISSGPLTEVVVNARLLLRAPKQASRCSGCDGIGVNDFNANGSYVICEHCQIGTSFSAWKRHV